MHAASCLQEATRKPMRCRVKVSSRIVKVKAPAQEGSRDATSRSTVGLDLGSAASVGLWCLACFGARTAGVIVAGLFLLDNLLGRRKEVCELDGQVGYTESFENSVRSRAYTDGLSSCLHLKRIELAGICMCCHQHIRIRSQKTALAV